MFLYDEFYRWAREKWSSVEVSDNLYDLKGVKIRAVDLNDPEALEYLEVRERERPEDVLLYLNVWEQEKDKWENRINSRLGVFKRRVWARKTKVEVLDKEEAKIFLDAYHIQGRNNLSREYWGLWLKEELLAVLSLGRHTRQISQNRIVLDRLVFKAGVQVVGGASKLFKAASSWAKDKDYDEIISFSDGRWAEGGVYLTLGFHSEKIYKPDYVYTKGGEIFSKQSQAKKPTKCPPDLTEHEWAYQRGLTRIYEGAKTRWVLPLKEGILSHSEVLSKRCANMHADGVFKHSHIRGDIDTRFGTVYYASSYELRFIYQSQRDKNIISLERGPCFEIEGRYRNPDFKVGYKDGTTKIVEVKPRELVESAFDQIQDSKDWCAKEGYSFEVFTEDSITLKPHAIPKWAREYLALKGQPHHRNKIKKQNKERRRRYYKKNIKDKNITVPCEFCEEDHTLLKISYNRNVKKNGRYICIKENGALVGKRKSTRPKRTEEQKKAYQREWQNKKYREKTSKNKITVYCSFCLEDHSILSVSHAQNVKRNGRYICLKESRSG